MFDRIRRFVLRQPIGSVSRRIAFGALAPLLVPLEFLTLWLSSGTLNVFTAEWILLSYALLALTGWLPATGGTLFTIVTLTGVLLPDSTLHTTFTLLGIYAVAADWVSRRWYLPALLVIASTETIQLMRSANPLADVAGLIFGTASAIAIGLVLQWNHKHVEDLETRAEEARLAASRAGEAVRHDLTVNLHDTVAQDLTRIIVASQSIARRTTDAQAGEDTEALGELARHAMRQVRALIDDAGLSHPDPAEPLAEVLTTCQTMLAGRSITLAAELPDDADTAHSLRQRTVLALAFREGSTNIFKYARAGSRATLTLEDLDEGAVALTMVNDIDPASDDVRATLAGGFGLENLITQAARESGRVQFGSNGGRWVLTMMLPGPDARENSVSIDAMPLDPSSISTEEAGT